MSFLVEVWSKGDTIEPEEGQSEPWTATINIISGGRVYGAAIEIHGHTKEIVEQRRDMIVSMFELHTGMRIITD